MVDCISDVKKKLNSCIHVCHNHKIDFFLYWKTDWLVYLCFKLKLFLTTFRSPFFIAKNIISPVFFFSISRRRRKSEFSLLRLYVYGLVLCTRPPYQTKIDKDLKFGTHTHKTISKNGLFCFFRKNITRAASLE